MVSLPVSAVTAICDTQSMGFGDRLTVKNVLAWRSKNPMMDGGIASFVSSDMFKSLRDAKSKARRWDHRLNAESKARKPSTLKEAARYLATPGLISLGGGLPSSQYFPLERIDIKVPNPPHFSETETREDGILKSAGKHDIAEGRSLYGNTSALDMAYRMFTTRGEYILVEKYTFPAAMETATPLGLKCIGINMDAEGLLPSHMDSILEDWDPSEHEGASKPWLLYTVPTGQNPTGITQGERRRRELYRVAQKHDVFILEDDPYYFLQMQPYTKFSDHPPPPSSHEEFLASLVPSLLSLDVDGRVMRMDSFSKVIAPGTRTGWITASEQIVERYIRHSELSTQNPSGVAQIVLYKLLEETWGHMG
ncbi:Aromatic/aminoadipate aminotransferase 1, partial [Peltigera leucophlebia]|nr:Aromatic/aminoadipate aminotransferase 1 [Peltigera leucophlebia]